jgi:P4 family phage/plasmid primase-like protien
VGVPPEGFTGGKTKPNWGVYPDDDQVEAWIHELGHASLGLRVPTNVLVVDVDAYDGKRGAETLEWWVDQVGEPLPPTWYSTSRQDGSMKLFFRVPEYGVDYAWREPGDGLELLHHGHRWVRVWPSRNPKTGGEERWFSPLGLEERPPTPDELTPLPEAWVRAFQSGRRSRAHVGRGHRGDRVIVTDLEGDPVDPRWVLLEGPPPGEQQNELFRWACSMRERRFSVDEAKVLMMAAHQRLENSRPNDPWTARHLHELVDRVWDTYPPGAPLTLPPEVQELAERLAGQVRDGVASSRVRVGVGVVEPAPREARATDMGNALRFVALHRDLVRYAADQRRWYVWDGRRWAPDQLNRVTELTKNVVDAVRAEAARDGADRDRWLAWAHQSESTARREALVRAAQSEPALVTSSDAFDRDPHLLVVRNGTVNLRTGELRPSRPEDMCTHLAEVDHRADAPHERWSAQVDLLCGGDPRLAAYVQRAVGYTLTGDVGERSFFFLEGDGSNGKNAFVEPLMTVMGSYAQAASTALLTGGDEQHATILADLQGSRLVFVDESRVERQLNAERLKALTGSKRVRARFMRRDFFEYHARFKLWIAGNGQPKLSDRSDGIWTRMHLIKCLGKVTENQKIKNYGDLLYAEEASGILNWALRGLVDWRKLGSLGAPASVRHDVEAYREEEDYERQFAEEHLVVTGDEEDALANDSIFQVYDRWAERIGLKRDERRNRTHLGRALGRLQVGRRDAVKSGGRTVRVVRGVRWLEEVNLVGVDDPLAELRRRRNLP